MATAGRLSELGALIQKNASQIENALASAGLPPATLSVGAPPVLPLPLDLKETQNELVEALDELRALTLGPMLTIMELMVGSAPTFATLHVIYSFELAKKLPIGEALSYAALGERCGLTEEDTRRFLRLAISMRLFEEPAKGMVQHNAASALLATLPMAHDFLGTMTEEMAPSSLRMAESLRRYPGSQEPKESAACIANGIDEDYYAYLARQPERARRAASAMSIGTKAPSHAASHFVDNCGWDKACPKKIVDVGGAHGNFSMALLERYDGIESAVSMDLPGVVDPLTVPEQFAGRLKFQGYDFLTPQTARDVDVVLFRNVFHDWSDKYAIKIIENQIPALKPGSRIFVNETCLPEFSSSTISKDRFGRTGDLVMKIMYNAKERSRDDWEALFSAVDKRFKLVSIRIPPGAGISIIEVAWEG